MISLCEREDIKLKRPRRKQNISEFGFIGSPDNFRMPDFAGIEYFGIECEKGNQCSICRESKKFREVVCLRFLESKVDLVLCEDHFHLLAAYCFNLVLDAMNHE